MLKAIAYTDGSYNDRIKKYGSGAYVEIEGKKPVKYCKGGSKPEVVSMRQIGGELYAVVAVLDYCKAKGVTELDLYYDYKGIANWALPKEQYRNNLDTYLNNCKINKRNIDPRVTSKYTIWKAKTMFTQWYQLEILNAMQVMKIRFHKVDAHTGVELNELVDKLSKKACGIC